MVILKINKSNTKRYEKKKKKKKKKKIPKTEVLYIAPILIIRKSKEYRTIINMDIKLK